MKERGDRWRLVLFGLVMLVGVALFVIHLRGGLGIVYRITTGSMAPTLPVGSSVIVNPWAYRMAAPQRGDIIVYSYPLDPNVSYVHRVIGLPGDVIEIRDKRVLVNDAFVNEPYVIHDDPTIFPLLRSLPEPYRSRDQFGPRQVPANAFFVMGDNRDRASDSRYWGCLPRELVRGRVIQVIP